MRSLYCIVSSSVKVKTDIVRFYRSTHLARHEQSRRFLVWGLCIDILDTQAKPYICPKCHHPFGRLFLVLIVFD